MEAREPHHRGEKEEDLPPSVALPKAVVASLDLT
jgi:hypothetical protein